jgi:hypothetical protein
MSSIQARFDRIRGEVRSRIGLDWPVTLVKLPSGNSLGIGPRDAMTRTNDDMTGHETFVLDGGDPPESTFYHELCHARMNELGFKRAELDARQAERDPTMRTGRLRYPIILLGEAYADAVLYAVFPAESHEVRSQLLESFGSTGGLGVLLREIGTEAIGQAAQFRVSLVWSGDPSSDRRLATFAAHVFRDGEKTVYDRAYAEISGLAPNIEGTDLNELSLNQIRGIVRAAIAMPPELKT